MTEPYYADESVTLYHGDFCQVTEWLAADVLVTDPPYGIRRTTGGPRKNSEGVRGVSRSHKVLNDTDTTDRDAALIMWAGRPALVFGSWRVHRPPFVKGRLIWFKRNTNPGLGGEVPWCPADEEIYVLGRGWVGPRELNVLITDEARSGLGGLAARTGHPTPKPVDLMERLIAHCPPGVVADPFAGSGATLLAARSLGRLAIGVELSEEHCEKTARRLERARAVGVVPA